jgi:hypothetical protein
MSEAKLITDTEQFVKAFATFAVLRFGAVAEFKLTPIAFEPKIVAGIAGASSSFLGSRRKRSHVRIGQGLEFDKQMVARFLSHCSLKIRISYQLAA